MRRSRIAVLTAATTLFASGALAASASALYHEMRISEVHRAVSDADDFVELQMYFVRPEPPDEPLRPNATTAGGNEFSTFPIPPRCATARTSAPS